MDLKNRAISPNSTLIEALKIMDQIDKKLLIIMNEQNFRGLVSIGDIQRAIIKNTSLDAPILDIVRTNLKIGKPEDNEEMIKKTMIEFRMELYPIVDGDGKLVKVYFWEDFIDQHHQKKLEQFHVPVVIMAGGFGTRLKPITNVIPKAMIPIGEKTMLEEIIDRFGAHGCKHFYLSVNYKAELIKFYLEQQQLPHQIEYIEETVPLGTAGSLSMLKGKIHQPFFVNNCDILIEDDYAQILNYHNREKNLITVVAALKSYHIPYGTVKSGENGVLTEIKEKPDLTFMINSGMYILEPSCLDMIVEGEFFHITDLIKKIQQQSGKVGVFPVSEKAWIDMGDWSEYTRFLKL